MKKSMKAVLALVLAAVLLLSTVGCSSADKTWSAKYDGETLPIGSYIYYLAAAGTDAAGLVEDTEKSVLKQTVEGKDAEEWIREKAEYYVAYYFAVQKLMKERGLSLDEAAVQNAESAASSYWSQMGENLTAAGVAYSSFQKVIALQYEQDAIFISMYLEGGEKEVKDEELKEYFEDTYMSYSFAPSYMYYYDEDGKYNLLTEDEQAEVEASLQELLDKFNSGKIDKEKLIKELESEKYYTAVSAETETDVLFTDTIDKKDDTTEFGKALSETELGKATLYNTGAGLFYIIIKQDIKDKTENYLENTDKRNSLVGEYKGEEFSKFIEEEAKALQGSIEFNEAAIKKQKVSKFF